MNSLPGCRADGGRAFRNARSFQPAPRRSAHPASLILLGLLTPSLLALLSSSPSIGLGVLALPRSQPLRRDVTLSSDVLRPDDSHDDLLSDEDGFDWSAHSEDQISAKREGRMRVQDAPGGGNTNQLHGRFLHLTDIVSRQSQYVPSTLKSSPSGIDSIRTNCTRSLRPYPWDVTTTTQSRGKAIEQRIGEHLTRMSDLPRSSVNEPPNVGFPKICSDCDSPLSLYNVTMDWLEQEWADEVDFVICACPYFFLPLCSYRETYWSLYS